jgi:hypothetical protein
MRSVSEAEQSIYPKRKRSVEIGPIRLRFALGESEEESRLASIDVLGGHRNGGGDSCFWRVRR